MSQETVFWLLGFVGMAVTCVGGIVMRDRYMMTKFADLERQFNTQLHMVRMEFARRDDFNNAITSFESSLKEMREEIRENNRQTNNRIDTILNVIGNNRGAL